MVKMAVAALIVMSVSGCVSLHPEREMINQLIGKDVNEAKGFLFSTMGNPVYEPTPVPSIIADSIPGSGGGYTNGKRWLTTKTCRCKQVHIRMLTRVVLSLFTPTTTSV